MLFDSRIILEEISDDDVNGVFECYSNQEIMEYFGVKPIENKDEALNIIKRNIAMKEEQTGIRYIAKLKDTSEFVGLITMKRYNSIHFRAEIDYIVLPKYQRKGFASEMMKLFLMQVSESWELKRLSAYVDLVNQPSCKLLEKSGFTKEGILRSWVCDGHSFSDVYSYSFIFSDLK